MHCFIWFIATGALWSVAAAATARPLLSISHPTPLVVRRGYQEQDTARAFYSYGYSDENAARAEYSTRDGSSRGFYSYVDANGQLQTVKYEAGGLQGFKAEASNQPKAPVDNQKPPLPVTDTAEVQEARQAHLSAIRAAQEKAREELEREREQQKDEQPLSDEDAAILERVRAELSSMLAERQRGEEARLADERSAQESADRAESEDQEKREQQREEEREQAREREESRQRLQLANDANDLRLRTVYSLADISSSSYLKLSDLDDRLNRDSQGRRVPVSAYYSYVSPESKYSVTTPTELRTLRPVALSRSLILSKRN